jgi:hypothetical protein
VTPAGEPGEAARESAIFWRFLEPALPESTVARRASPPGCEPATAMHSPTIFVRQPHDSRVAEIAGYGATDGRLRVCESLEQPRVPGCHPSRPNGAGIRLWASAPPQGLGNSKSRRARHEMLPSQPSRGRERLTQSIKPVGGCERLRSNDRVFVTLRGSCRRMSRSFRPRGHRSMRRANAQGHRAQEAAAGASAEPAAAGGLRNRTVMGARSTSTW